MLKHYIFKTYNELNKEFEVHVMLVKDQYQFKLVKRLDGDKPPRLTLEGVNQKVESLDKKIETLDMKIDKLAQIMQNGFDKINQRIDDLEKIVIQDHKLLLNVIKLNNLKTK